MRRTPRAHARPQFETLERRQVLSEVVGAFATFPGVIQAPADTDSVTVHVRRGDFSFVEGRLTLVFELRAEGGSLFDPGPLTLTRLDDGLARILHRDADADGSLASVLIVSVTPGSYRIDFGADDGLIGPYRLHVSLAGDANGNYQVATGDARLIAAHLGRSTSEPGVPRSADVDRDGRVTRNDLLYATHNLGASTRIRPLRVSAQLDSRSDPERNGIIVRPDILLKGRTHPNARVGIDVANDGTFEATVDTRRPGTFEATVGIPLGRTEILVRATDSFGQSADTLVDVVRADEVINWNASALQLIRKTAAPPTVASRALAMMHAAIHDVIATTDRAFPAYHVERVGQFDVSRDAAIATAAHRILARLFPTQGRFLKTARAGSLDPIPRGIQRRQGTELGSFVADRILRLRANDGANQRANHTPGSAPGQWRPTPPSFANATTPQWARVRPFVLRSSQLLRAPAPPALDSELYLESLAQVQTLGSNTSSVRTQDQTEIALFWSNGRGTETSPGHWNRIALHIAIDTGQTLAQNARLFGLLNFALADAGIAAWDSQFAYNFWRPITAIREADTSTVPSADPNWTPLLITPSHPSYISDQSAFSASAAAILTAWYGDQFTLSTTSSSLPGTTRAYTSFVHAAEEAGWAGIYGGIHFAFDNQHGQTAGREVARIVLHALT